MLIIFRYDKLERIPMNESNKSIKSIFTLRYNRIFPETKKNRNGNDLNYYLIILNC